MKILLICRRDGWMGLHMSHFAEGFRALGHEITMIDYHSWDRPIFALYSSAKKAKIRQRHQMRELNLYVSRNAPDLIIFVTSRLIYDFSELRTSYSGVIIHYDLDGPQFGGYADGLQWISNVDILLTVSRYTEKLIRTSGYSNVHYLPHGVNTDYYAPSSLTDHTDVHFDSPLAFLGKPTPRRAAFLKHLASDKLALWGARWSKRPYADQLSRCVRSKENILGTDVVRLYEASGVMLNILRETLASMSTIMNLQVFAVPSTGTCLLTEKVDELSDAFEPDKEILCFTTLDEFVEKARRYSKDLNAAARIGAAGRIRCIANHTHRHRAAELMSILGN